MKKFKQWGLAVLVLGVSSTLASAENVCVQMSQYASACNGDALDYSCAATASLTQPHWECHQTSFCRSELLQETFDKAQKLCSRAPHSACFWKSCTTAANQPCESDADCDQYSFLEESGGNPVAAAATDVDQPAVSQNPSPADDPLLQ